MLNTAGKQLRMENGLPTKAAMVLQETPSKTHTHTHMARRQSAASFSLLLGTAPHFSSISQGLGLGVGEAAY
jgi:hypothetical protein